MTVSILSIEEMNSLKARVEQLEVQLAGCGVAAQGYGDELKQGDHGWSLAYAHVKELWDKYEKLLKANKGGDW